MIKVTVMYDPLIVSKYVYVCRLEFHIICKINKV